MKIRQCVTKVKGYILTQVILSLVATMAIAFIPVCNKCLVDLFLGNSKANFVYLAIGYIASYFVYLLATWGSERFVWKSAITFENELKKACYEAILKLNYKDYKLKKSDEYLSLLTNNITSIEQDYLQPICALIKSAVSVVVYAIIVSIYTSPIICVVLIVLSVGASLSPRLYKNKLKEAGKEYVDSAAIYTKKTADLLDGAELVDNNTRNGFARQNILSTDFLSNKRHHLGKAKVNGNTIFGSAICLIDTIVFILCGVLMLKGKITIGVIFAAITYAQAFTEPVEEILYDINTLNASKDIVKELENMLNCNTTASDIVTYANSKEDIVLKDVCVNLSEKKLLFNASFTNGKKYLIVGQSGMGKTTLLDTITGISNIESGNVRVVEGYFYLSQHQHVFSDSAYNNISIFGTYDNFDKIDKLDIPMYERIKNEDDCSVLSGGEKQVLKFCRMLVQGKNTLIIDEPFSALDNSNARKLFHILSNMSKTIILVSHKATFDENDLKNWEIVKIEDICHEKEL